MSFEYIDVVVTIIETLFLAFVVLMLNWVSTQIIAPNVTIKNLEILCATQKDPDKLRTQSKKIIKDFEEEKKVLSIIWGPELSSASVGLYFAILALWASRSGLFSLSKILGVNGTSWDVVVWVLLFIFYILLLALSIFCKESSLWCHNESKKILYLTLSNSFGLCSMGTLIIFLKYVTSLG
jgi:hypothetical protein